MENNDIALMTCAITRLVHLELVPDIALTSLITSLPWFMSIRGMSKRFFFQIMQKRLKQNS